MRSLVTIVYHRILVAVCIKVELASRFYLKVGIRFRHNWQSKCCIRIFPACIRTVSQGYCWFIQLLNYWFTTLGIYGTTDINGTRHLTDMLAFILPYCIYLYIVTWQKCATLYLLILSCLSTIYGSLHRIVKSFPAGRCNCRADVAFRT